MTLTPNTGKYFPTIGPGIEDETHFNQLRTLTLTEHEEWEVDDAKHGPELTGCRSLQLRLYRIEGCLQGGAQSHCSLQHHEGGHGPYELILGGLLHRLWLEKRAGFSELLHLSTICDWPCREISNLYTEHFWSHDRGHHHYHRLTAFKRRAYNH